MFSSTHRPLRFLGLLARLAAVLLVVVASAPSTASADVGPARDTRNGSPEFHALYRSVAAGKATMPDGSDVLAPDAKDRYTVLLVRGLFGNTTTRLAPYFADGVRELRARGFEITTASLDTEAPVERNAQALRAEILRASSSGKQVILLGHSMAGAVIPAALERYQDELDPKVRMVACFQCAYRGTPLIDFIERHRVTRAVANAFVAKVLGGDPQVLRDLTVSHREAYVAQHPYPSDVPTVSVAGEAAKTSLLRPSRWLLARSAGGGPLDRGAKNDGAVPVRSMRLPGSTVVRLVGDHLSFTMDRTRGLGARLPGAPHDAGAVIVTSVALGLRIPDARARPPSTPRTH